MPEEADDYRHPKCYAKTRGGCSTKISGEHYVSHGLIKLYGKNDPGFTIQHKTGKGVGHPIRPKNFKANILCQKHNTALHPADDAALAFATFLRRIALQYDAGAGEWGDAEEVTISGDDMQRWVLKLFLNHAVTGHFDVQQDNTVTFPSESIDLLLDRAAWPSTWGLTVPGETRSKDVRACPFQPIDVVNSHWWGVAPFVHKDKTWIGGGIVDLAHVSFGLTLFNPGRGMPGWDNPGNHLHGSLQRPAFISWELEGLEKRINFTWDYPLHHLGITYALRPQNKADRLAGKLPVGQHIWLE
ncbi:MULTISPECIES: hypothetical protein [Mycobacterium]|jgi:hypothetical protein|uniref:Uncharacterized protein n=1 Tax=Mycobacterium conspicuum TaxID=44010 RepID=A0A7I7Y9D5_9MYCO|nr:MULTISPECIES: hypothetical protein [Mycobacterium]MCV7052064.1 hypothetical protein [Mycobacterium heidelbergense]OIN81451.1 hypothetical protein BMG05_07455 [Mycobacterium malmoense]BBZ38250.1 hypothetical protein MCNS_13130 [Mycobacterium conspicuum]BBZ48876.1 hypothetical protein MHEI_05930 [Mycobacterium heidelbergense]